MGVGRACTRFSGDVENATSDDACTGGIAALLNITDCSLRCTPIMPRAPSIGPEMKCSYVKMYLRNAYRARTVCVGGTDHTPRAPDEQEIRRNTSYTPANRGFRKRGELFTRTHSRKRRVGNNTNSKHRGRICGPEEKAFAIDHCSRHSNFVWVTMTSR